MSDDRLKEIFDSINLQMIVEQNVGYRNKYSPILTEEIDLYNAVIKYKEVINKAIELLGNYKHYSTPDEEQNSDNEDLVNKAFDILKEVEND